MATWLDKASGLFQRSANGSSEREAFQLTCECGARSSGLRESRLQQIPCSACHRVLFALPENRYPRPSPTAKKKKFAAQPLIPRKTEVADEVDLEVTPPRPERSGGIDIHAGVRPRRPKTQPAAPAPPPPGIASPQPARRWITPLRVIVVFSLLLIAGTGVGLAWRARIEQARQQLPQALEAGLLAFSEQRFAEAERELTLAMAAVRTLGKQDAETDAIRRLWREARAANGLPGVLLTEGLSNPAADLVGRWLVLDVSLAWEDSEPVIDAPFLIGDQLVELDFPVPEAVSAVSPGERPRRLIVAGQVAAFDAPAGKSGPAVLHIDSKSAFLWTDFDTYRALGLTGAAADEPALRDVFARQLRWEDATP